MRQQKLRSLRDLYDATSELSEPKITPVLQGDHQIQGPADELGCALGTYMNKLGKHVPCRTFHMTVEPGTCNVSAIPCSSFVHVKRVALKMGKEAGELLEEACLGKAPSQCSFHDACLLSSSKSSVYNNRLYTNSEASNLLSVCSSHDPLSENAESKATLRASDVSEDVEMLQNVTTVKSFAYDHSSFKPNVFHSHRTFLNQYDKLKDFECHGDNVSCISGDDGGNVITHQNCGTDRNNISCGSVSINTLSDEGSEKAASGCPASKPSSCHCKVQPVQLASIFSNKPDPSEVSASKDVNALASSLTGEPSESSIEQVESLSAKLEGISVMKFVKPKVEIDKVEPITEAVICCDQNEHLKKSSALVEATNVLDAVLRSQLVDGSGILDDEVKICDICGDVGWEALLAICSKCSDGAEHIYCMRVKMKDVPGADWMCEECMFMEKIRKQKKDSKGFSIEVSRGSSYFKTSSENCTKLDTKDSDVEKGKSSLLSAKRPLDNFEVASVAKRRAPETTDGTPRTASPCGKAYLSLDSSSKDSSKGKRKITTLRNNSYSLEASLCTTSIYNSPRVQSRLPKVLGSLLKSNSFNVIDSRQQVKPPKEGIQKQKGGVSSVTSDMKNEGIVRVMSKSSSFNTPKPNHPNFSYSKVKMPSSKFRNSVKKLRPAKVNGLPSCLAMLGSASSDLDVAERLSSHIETKLQGSSHSNCHDLKNFQSQTNANLPNPACRLPHIAGSGIERKSSSSLDGVGAFSPVRCSRKLNLSQILSKDEMHKKQNFPLQSDGLSVSNFTSKSRVAAKVQLSSYASGFSSGGTNEDQDRSLNEAKQQAIVFAESASAFKATEYSPASPSVEAPFFKGCPRIASAVTVPEIDCIWQGGFKIQCNQMLPGFVDKVQAHLSTFASPRVLEVITKFPSRVLLEEVPRISTWPVQFSENAAAEDDIALYFFAEDLESYKRNYRSLLECMIKNDLALKGNFGGIEVLIFSSSLLPAKSQRWNNLYFLWGVFRVRTNYSEHASFRKKIFAPSLCGVISDQNTSICIQSSESLTVCNVSDSVQAALRCTALQDLPSVTFGRKDVNCEPKVSSSEHKLSAWQTNFDQQPIQCVAVEFEESTDNMQCTSMPLKEHGNPEKRQAVNNPCQHAGRENDMDYSNFDTHMGYKRLKTSISKYGNNEGIDGSSNKFPSFGIGPSFPVEDHRYSGAAAMDLLEKTRTHTGSSVGSADQDSLDNVLRLKSSQFQALPPICNGSISQGVNLELSLGRGETSTYPEVLHVFLPTVDEKNNKEEYANQSENNDATDDDDTLLKSLSLSLALPGSKTF